MDHDISGEVLARAVEIAEVPAPTFAEDDRRALLRSWWVEKGLSPEPDDAGNLRARVTSGRGPALMVCAHLDTVFPATVDHAVVEESGRLVGPSIGDDSLGLAALTVLADLLSADLGREVWIVATTGEEGHGDLAGVRHAIAHPPAALGALLAVEGTLFGEVVTRGVGSVRWRVTLAGPGGHAWHEAARPSAVHELGRIITRLDALADRAQHEASVNVGSAGGGEAINARARDAWLELDLRAVDASQLQRLAADADAIVRDVQDLDVSVEVIGERPAGSVDPSHFLVANAAAALRDQGVEPQFTAASTDANAAHAVGLPAIALGITTGGNEHTEQEWIDTAPVAKGMAALASTIVEAAGRLG